MPYSMDPEANQQNPATPSPYMSLHEQLIYKLAALDAAVQSGFRRLDEKMDRFQTDLHDSQIETNDRINKLESETVAHFLLKRQRIDALERSQEKFCKIEKIEAVENTVRELEKWQTIAMARLSLAGGAILMGWTFIAPTVRAAFGMGE